MVPSASATVVKHKLRQTKIEVLDRRWDPHSGCSRACPNCWAKEAAKTTGDFSFRPTFHPELLEAPIHARGYYRIGVCWGGDLWDPEVKPEHRQAIINAAKKAPWHTYLFLTKNADNIHTEDFSQDALDRIRVMDYFWLGTSVTRRGDIWRVPKLTRAPQSVRKWISFEPLLQWIPNSDLDYALTSAPVEWIMVGALTAGGMGSRSRIAPTSGGTTPDMVQTVVNAAARHRIPVFLKNNLAGLAEQVIDPRTGERFRSVLDWRELPPVLGGKELSLYEL